MSDAGGTEGGAGSIEVVADMTIVGVDWRGTGAD